MPLPNIDDPLQTASQNSQAAPPGTDPDVDLETGAFPDPAIVETYVPAAVSTPSPAVLPGSSLHPPGGGLPTVPGDRVLHEIAPGGLGKVLAAYDPTLDRDVSLKILLPGADADRFVHESKITARLPHPGIPPVYALGTLPDGSPFLAMKLIAGQTLADEMKTDERLRLLQAFTQICQAVGFARCRGIIHRNLKPANVMVGAFGEVQVMDWGLAKETRNEEGGRMNDEDESSDISSSFRLHPSTRLRLGRSWGRRRTWLPSRRSANRTSAHYCEKPVSRMRRSRRSRQRCRSCGFGRKIIPNRPISRVNLGLGSTIEPISISTPKNSRWPANGSRRRSSLRRGL